MGKIVKTGLRIKFRDKFDVSLFSSVKSEKSE